MKLLEKMITASLVFGILTVPFVPSAQAWPDPNKAMKDAQKAGRKASKQARGAAKKTKKQLKNSGPKKMFSAKSRGEDYIDVCRTPAPPVKGGVPVPYPNTNKINRDLKRGKKQAEKVKSNADRAAKNASKAASNQYKSANRNARKAKKQFESSTKNFPKPFK